MEMEAGEDDEGEDDEERPSSAPTAPLPPPPPLFWGPSENNAECLVVSSAPGPGLSPFPAGCFFESLPEGENGGGKSRLDNFCRRAASRATREVLVSSSGGSGGGAAGLVRPLRYKTKSGKDLKVVE